MGFCSTLLAPYDWIMRTFISLDEEKPTFHKLTTVFFFFYLFIFLKALKHACLDSIYVISLPGLTQKRSFYPLVSLLALCVGQRSHQHQPGSCRTGAVVLDVHVCLTCAPLCLQQSHKSEQHVQTQVSRGPVGSDAVLTIIFIAGSLPAHWSHAFTRFSGRITLQARDSNTPEAASRAAVKRRKAEVGRAWPSPVMVLPQISPHIRFLCLLQPLKKKLQPAAKRQSYEIQVSVCVCVWDW